MSNEAFAEYEEALKKQHTRNEARRIRSRVAEARMSPQVAGARWPFELLQNALDAGPRPAAVSVSVRFRRTPIAFVFEHDGAPFTFTELAALLSGGSSKEFDSEVTTGRFGTGFLVTHVLAERARLRGLLDMGNGFEQFDLVLDRGGDEQSILKNIADCDEAIRVARRLTTLDGTSSAMFEYPVTDNSALSLGVDAFKDALPSLYATCPKLSRVHFSVHAGHEEVWSAEPSHEEVVEGVTVSYRTIRVEQNGDLRPELRVYRFSAGGAAAILLIERMGQEWTVVAPKSGTPRIYREYPVRGSAFLPLNFVLDGKFDPDQERNRLLMSDGDKALLVSALAACPFAVKYALQHHWRNTHLLGRVARPTAGFDASNPDELPWWIEQLADVAKQLASLPIVDCTSEHLPAISTDGTYADFALPRLAQTGNTDETTVERMLPLLEAAAPLLPPRTELAAEWTAIAQQWFELQVPVNTISLTRLADYVRDNATTLSELQVEGSPGDWLALFLDVVCECWEKRNGIELSLLDGLIPNQRKRLCTPKELYRDAGVTERLKDICDVMGYDARSQLLLSDLESAAAQPALKYLRKALATAIGKELSEKDVIDAAVQHLNSVFKEDEDLDDKTAEQQRGSIILLDYLWQTQGASAATIARTVPFFTSSGQIVRASRDRMLMAPVPTWGKTAQPFASAYPPQRVLDCCYAGDDSNALPNIVPALVSWRVAIADPLTTDIPAELKERRLAAIASEGADTSGVTVTNQSLSQVALLQPEVLNRCQEGVEEAKALLGLILCHIAPLDLAWRESRQINGKRMGKEVPLLLYPSLWLADLKFRAWVPMSDEDGKFVKVLANENTLKPLLDFGWLQNNEAAIQLLTKWFGFDELDLRLLGVSPDDSTVRAVRDGLAKLVETVGANPEVYTTLAAEAEARQRAVVTSRGASALALQYKRQSRLRSRNTASS